MRLGKPDHGTVVAYLALFVALGAGGAWAADKIRSQDIGKNAVRAKHIKKNNVRAKHIKRNSVRGKHIKRNSVRGKQIKDGSVGASDLRGGPGSGVDADTVDGVQAAGFLSSDRILWGRTPIVGNEALVLEWPEAGIEIRTHDSDSADFPYNIRIRNTNPPGGPRFWVTDGESNVSINPGDTHVQGGGLFGHDLFFSENRDGSQGRLMHLQCFPNVLDGSDGGDDGFMQCMGVTAGP